MEKYMSKVVYHNWTEEDLKAIEEKTTYTELAEVGVSILKRLFESGKRIVQVCGPMNTGGRGSLEENMKVFNLVIDHLVKQGEVVFDQRPFEKIMEKIKIIRGTIGYPYDLLEEFYGPIFASGYVDFLFFIPGWNKSENSEGSIGADWEYRRAAQSGIAIFEIKEELIERLLKAA